MEHRARRARGVPRRGGVEEADRARRGRDDPALLAGAAAHRQRVPAVRAGAGGGGGAGTADFMNLTPTDMEQARPPATWQPGEIIADEQVVTLRPDWRSANATVLVGLIEVGAHGTLDRMTVTPGPHTRDRAVVA